MVLMFSSRFNQVESFVRPLLEYQYYTNPWLNTKLTFSCSTGHQKAPHLLPNLKQNCLKKRYYHYTGGAHYLPFHKEFTQNLLLNLKQKYLKKRDYHYTEGAHYLPYHQESIEKVENYNNLINCIDALILHNQIRPGETLARKQSYKEYIQVQTKYIPLEIHTDRKQLLEDWNEVTSIITDMRVVPEEADQVSVGFLMQYINIPDV